MHDEITYKNAEESAAALTDDQLQAAHARYLAEDGQILDMFPAARGLIDDPYWTYVKFEARQRGIALES